MRKNKISTEFDNNQSSTLRTGKTFLMKPAIEANSFMCTEFNFDQTLECPRVIRLQDYHFGLEELTDEQADYICGLIRDFYSSRK